MTTADADRRRKAIDENYQAFLVLLPELLKTHPGKFLVMRDGKPAEFFDTARDAMVFGVRTYEDGLFSVQEVTDKKADLGYYSHAVHYA